ncbi:helix-turn-helix domain-containing protein [Enterococcus sp.]|uniref:helix-turn-helix domain-containing protein n=1 Tax=Enterococcus sp. TaxID=35783 RepID=UPI0028AE58DB|nr:helix-turn-helix transcriptional regulator [Enterococcus sp.]
MLGDNLKRIRKEKGLTLDTLSEALNNLNSGISFNKGKLSKWENNKEEPKLSSLKILADFYNIPIDILIDNQDINLTAKNKIASLAPESYVDKKNIELLRSLHNIETLFETAPEESRKTMLNALKKFDDAPKELREMMYIYLEMLSVKYKDNNEQ